MIVKVVKQGLGVHGQVWSEHVRVQSVPRTYDPVAQAEYATRYVIDKLQRAGVSLDCVSVTPILPMDVRDFVQFAKARQEARQC